MFDKIKIAYSGLRNLLYLFANKDSCAFPEKISNLESRISQLDEKLYAITNRLTMGIHAIRLELLRSQLHAGQLQDRAEEVNGRKVSEINIDLSGPGKDSLFDETADCLENHKNMVVKRMNSLIGSTPVNRRELNDDINVRIVYEVISLLKDPSFVTLSLAKQNEFFDYIRSVFGKTLNRNMIEVASALSKVFALHSKNKSAGLHSLLKMYDLLYFLFFNAASSIENMRPINDKVIIPFSNYLKDYLTETSFQPRHDFSDDGNIRLCYLLKFSNFCGGNAVGDYMYSLLRRHQESNQDGLEIIIYAWFAYSDDFVNKVRELGFTVRTFELAKNFEDLDKLREAFNEDNIDVVITDVNHAVPAYLFEGRVAPVQIFYQLGLPFWGINNIDAVFSGFHLDPSIIGFENTEYFKVKLLTTYHATTLPEYTKEVESERLKFPDASKVIGFYGRLSKVTEPYLSIMKTILIQNRDVICILGGTGDGTLINEFIVRHDLERRMFLIDEYVDGHIYSHIFDVFADTFPFVGGMSCQEALAKGKPVISMESWEMTSIISQFRDKELVARSSDEYVKILDRLINDGVFYKIKSDKSRYIITSSESDINVVEQIEGIVRELVKKIRREHCKKPIIEIPDNA